MISAPKSFRRAAAVVVSALSLAAAAPALAQEAAMSPDASAESVYNEIDQTIGFVPTFVKQFPKAAVGGLWAFQRDLEMSGETALDGKTKALISLAVASQIPCSYCIWADTNTAKMFGATDEEIAEAVAMSSLTRAYSTLFNGLQVDFETFKKELGGE